MKKIVTPVEASLSVDVFGRSFFIPAEAVHDFERRRKKAACSNCLHGREIRRMNFMRYVRVNLFPLEEVADPVFSTKMMGDGIAVKPSDDTIYSPCEGEIILFPDTKHAIGIRTQRGTEILVHIGLDTVNFHGQGFQKLFPDQRVQTGQPLIRLDRGF